MTKKDKEIIAGMFEVLKNLIILSQLNQVDRKNSVEEIYNQTEKLYAEFIKWLNS